MILTFALFIYVEIPKSSCFLLSNFPAKIDSSLFKNISSWIFTSIFECWTKVQFKSLMLCLFIGVKGISNFCWYTCQLSFYHGFLELFSNTGIYLFCYCSWILLFCPIISINPPNPYSPRSFVQEKIDPWISSYFLVYQHELI